MTDMMDPNCKYCSRCDTVKSLNDFYKDNRTKDGKAYTCKDCTKKRSAAWQKANPEKAVTRQKEWVVRNQERHHENQRRYHSIGGWRKRWYEKKYGLSVEQVMAMIESQGGRCAICDTTEPGGRGQFAVDHDHKTGQVRGMLCQHCNTGLGSFNDDVERLKIAIVYLDRYKAPKS